MDLLTWVEVVRRDALDDSARHLAWSDGALVAACDDGNVCVAPDGVHVRHRLDAQPTALAVGSGVVLCGALDGRVMAFSTSGTAAASLGRSITAAAAIGDGFVVAHGDQLTVVDVDAAADRHLRPGPSVDPGVGTVTVLDRVAGRMALVGGTCGCSWFDGGFCIVDDHHALPTIVAVASDRRARRVALGDLGGSIHVLQPGGAEPVELTGYPDRVGLLCWTTDGRHLCAAAADEVTVWTPDDAGHGDSAPPIWRTAHGHDHEHDDHRSGDDRPDEPLRLVGHDDAITALAASPTDGLVASGDAGGHVRLWSPGRLDTPVGTISADGIVLALAWRRDGRSLAVSTSDGSLLTAYVRPGAVA